METMVLKVQDASLFYTPESASWQIELPCGHWEWRKDAAVILNTGDRILFSEANCSAKSYVSGIGEGFYAVYTDFGNRSFKVHTWVSFDRADGTLRCTFRVEGDELCEIKQVNWPAAICFDVPAGEGYTVLPKKQGVMVPARWEKQIHFDIQGRILSVDSFMPMYGQVKGRSAYCAIYDTPADVCYFHGHVPGGKTEVET